ncbi:MAG TPA: hypothetical protein PKC43_02955 [Phycisphaerales bacterium]|nr:hypothetical protein [Phycisphaerales bacterium]HMP36386.1 hypothetical protein [Phycisphaerales bacterium]
MAASNRNPSALDDAVVVALHRLRDGAGAAWHAVALRRDAGARGEAPLRLIETRSFPEQAELPPRQEIGRWCDRCRAARVVIVLPAGRAVCRSTMLPDGPPDRLLAALRLQTEAHLAGAIPAHRLAFAVLPKGPVDERLGDGGQPLRSALITGWPEGSEPVPWPLPERRGELREVTWIAEASALAAIVGGERPRDPALWLCREEGVVALALSTPSGVVIRTAREEAEDDQGWRLAVRRTVVETALASGLGGETLTQLAARTDQRLAGAGATALLLPDELRDSMRERVAGESSDPGWWSRYGIALGAAACAAGELAALARLQESTPTEHPSPVIRAARALSQPRTAVTLAALAVVLFAFGPLAFARVRLGILRTKAPDLAELREQNAEHERRRAMYRELRSQTLPVSKLLADIANTTPMGVELRSITIDRAQGVQVSGVAAPDAKGEPNQPAGERIARMAALMEATGVFELPKRDVKQPTTTGVREFTLVSSITNGFRRFDFPREQDFGAVTMVNRLYPPPESERGSEGERPAAPSGENGSPSEAAAVVAMASENGTADAPRSAPRPSGGGRAARSEPRDEAREAGAAEAADAAMGEAGELDDGGRRSGVARRSAGDVGGAARRGDRLGAAPSAPEPLSAEQINAMTETQVKDALAAVAMARSNLPPAPAAGVEDPAEDLRKRLTEEWNMLLERQKQLRRRGTS